VGDLVDDGQDYSLPNRWFDAAQGVADTIAVMPITGYHESYIHCSGAFPRPFSQLSV